MNSDPARSAIGTSSQPLNIMMLSPFFAVAAIVALLPGLAIWLGMVLLLISGLVISDLIRYLGRRLAARPTGALVPHTTLT